MDNRTWDYPLEMPAGARAALDKVAEMAAGLPGLVELTPVEARKIFDPLWANYARELATDKVRITETVLPLPTGSMPVRIHDPAPGIAQPLMIFVHGGGWVLLKPDASDLVCEELCLALDCKIVSLDYPMAPEHPVPGPVDACVAATEYLATHKLDGLATNGRTFIGGDSAGANLSLAVLLRLRGKPASPSAGILLYGVFDNDHTTRSHRIYGGGDYYLSTSDMAWYWGHYLTGASDASQARVLHADLTGLPPLFLAGAEFDCLRDDTTLLADRLAKAGVPHALHLIPGAFHGCLNLSPYFPQLRDTRGAVAKFLEGV